MCGPCFIDPDVGVQGQKVWEHDFEITGDPKGSRRGPTFWSGYEAPNP